MDKEMRTNFMQRGAPKGTWDPARSSAEVHVDEVERLTGLHTEGMGQPCPFTVGQFITPKSGSGIHGRGLPWKVLDTFPKKFTPAQDGHASKLHDCILSVVIGPDTEEPEDRVRVFAHNSDRFELWESEKFVQGEMEVDEDAVRSGGMGNLGGILGMLGGM